MSAGQVRTGRDGGQPGPDPGVLLERDSELRALRSFWGEALGGRGRLVFLGGEAGSGKTSLAAAFLRRVAGRVLIGACDGGSTPRPLGPLVDVAEELDVVGELSQDGRRGSLFPRVRTALGQVPTVLLLEDVHGADEASADLVRYLVRRLNGLPVLLIATFRDDEVAAGHPLAVLMGDLATVASVTRMQVPLLTRTAVAALAGAAGRDLDVEALYLSTDGNPFLVTEVLAAGTDQLPTTVRDAVSARTARLSPAARRVVDTAAVIGSTADIGLVLQASGEDVHALDECVRLGVLQDHRTSVAFRHDLTRQAVLDGLSPSARTERHRQVLARLVDSGSQDHRRLAQHAVACGDAPSVVRHAPRAAEQAARLGAHREAAAQLRTARQYGGGLPPAARAEVLERLSYQCYLTSELGEAVDAQSAAISLREAITDRRGVGVGQRWLSRYFWHLGRSADARRLAEQAVATLEPLGPGGDLAMAYSNLSQLQMLSGETAGALTWGRRAYDEASAAGDREVQAHALNNLGSALMLRGDVAGGLARLEQSLEIALSDELEEHATRAWTNIGTLQFSKRLLGDAEQSLRTGAAYCAERDLVAAALYLQSRLAQVLLERGLVDQAERLAGDTLRHPNGSAVSRMAALLTTATVAVRTADPTATAQLAELRTLARRTSEPQRLLPVALVEAEAAWTAGRTADIVALTQDVWTDFRSWEPWVLAELAWWRRLAGAQDVDDEAFEQLTPFASMRAGRVREASDAWRAIGRPFWAAVALAGGGPTERAEAVAGLLRLGAPASAQAVRRDLGQRGLPVPRGPRGAARANPVGLTARELDVVGFLVEGLSDADIARRLTLSERTVGHHVSAVLRKLGVPSRSRAAAAARTLLDTRQSG